MALTPQDIVRKEFREALRGYNQADVDLFLDEVVEEFTRLSDENAKMKARVATLQQELSRVQGGAPSATVSPERLDAEVRGRLRRFFEEQIRALETSPTVERIQREVPPPPSQQRPESRAEERPSSPPSPEDPPRSRDWQPFWSGD